MIHLYDEPVVPEPPPSYLVPFIAGGLAIALIGGGFLVLGGAAWLIGGLWHLIGGLRSLTQRQWAIIGIIYFCWSVLSALDSIKGAVQATNREVEAIKYEIKYGRNR